MKKLLFITALLVLGTATFAVNPAQDETASAEVLVKAEIVEDFFSITDIDGNPLILDFKKVPKKNLTQDPIKANVRYKVTAKEEITQDLKLTMTLAGKGLTDGGVPVEIYQTKGEGDTQEKRTLTPKLLLDNYEKTMGTTGECQGVIYGVIAEDTTNKVKGEYEGYTTLTATYDHQ